MIIFITSLFVILISLMTWRFIVAIRFYQRQIPIYKKINAMKTILNWKLAEQSLEDMNKYREYLPNELKQLLDEFLKAENK